MPILMRNIHLKIALPFFLFISIVGRAQIQEIQQIRYLLDDALFFSEKYITPATDCAVYQASSSWMNTPQKKKFGEFSLALHGNLFFVPNRDRNFQVANSDFKLFTIEGANQTTVPTALGGNTDVYYNASIGTNPLRIASPKGVDMETVFHPFLQGNIALWKGTELIARYSTKVKLKKGNYQVYGFGIKHNISQYMPYLEKNKIALAFLTNYSNEEISFDFLDINTPLGNLGLNEITGFVDTYQFQVAASKQFGNFEIMASSITNKSNFKYKITGEKGSIEDVLNFQEEVNRRLKSISKEKFNALGEIACRYHFSKIFVKSSVAFGKFVNTNFSVEYEF